MMKYLLIVLVSITTVPSMSQQRTYIRSEAEGKSHLDTLLALYPDSAAFEQRKLELRNCLTETMGLNLQAKRSAPNVITRSKRSMKGYTVENVAFESFPGYFVTGSLYRPRKSNGKLPAIVCPHGHFPDAPTAENINLQGRYRRDMQMRCAVLAKMGAVVFDYDMYAWGESRLQTGKDINDNSNHSTGFSLAIQTWNSIRVVDFLENLPDVDSTRIGVTGASGGGTQTFLLTALDNRIAASAPVVMVSSWFNGGCGCESGLPIHQCGRANTNNAEFAALAAPRPQLVVSDGTDWTNTVPQVEYPYLQKVYDLYGMSSNIYNTHLPNEKHDYGYNKRVPMYRFFAEQFKLNLASVTNAAGEVNESFVTIENAMQQQVFNKDFPLPANALHGHEKIVAAFTSFQQKGGYQLQ